MQRERLNDDRACKFPRALALSLKSCEKGKDSNTIRIAYRSFVIPLPDEFVVIGGGATPLSAKFYPFFSISDSVHVIPVQLLEAFNNGLFRFSLHPVAIIPESLMELYN